MRISIRGNDGAYAMALALILITLFSTLFISFVSRAEAMRKYSAKSKVLLINSIEASNKEILSHHEFY